MKLKARQYIRYNRKPYSAGAVFEAAPSDAHILIAIGKAETYVDPPPKPKPVPAVFKPIVTDAAPPATPAIVPSAQEDEPKKRGSYKRRDMLAEE